MPLVVRKKEFKSEEDLPQACSDLSAAYLSFKQASTAEEKEAARRAVTTATLALSTVPNRWWDSCNPAPGKVDGRHRHAPRIIHRLDKGGWILLPGELQPLREDDFNGCTVAGREWLGQYFNSRLRIEARLKGRRWEHDNDALWARFRHTPRCATSHSHNRPQISTGLSVVRRGNAEWLGLVHHPRPNSQLIRAQTARIQMGSIRMPM